MQSRQDPELEQLLQQMAGPERASQILQQIQAGEQLLREHPAPEPRPELIDQIKREIFKQLGKRERPRPWWLARAIAVAAAVVILVSITVTVLDKGSGSARPFIPAALWETLEVGTEDPELAYFATELDQIESQIRALGAGEVYANGDLAVTELELELLELDSGFWKGW